MKGTVAGSPIQNVIDELNDGSNNDLQRHTSCSAHVVGTYCCLPNVARFYALRQITTTRSTTRTVIGPVANTICQATRYVDPAGGLFPNTCRSTMQINDMSLQDQMVLDAVSGRFVIIYMASVSEIFGILNSFDMYVLAASSSFLQLHTYT